MRRLRKFGLNLYRRMSYRFYESEVSIEIRAADQNIVEIVLNSVTLQVSQHVCDHAGEGRG